MKKNMTLFVLLLCTVQLLHAQNVGIGTITPAYEFQVNNRPCCALQYNRFKSLVFLLQQRQ